MFDLPAYFLEFSAVLLCLDLLGDRLTARTYMWRESIVTILFFGVNVLFKVEPNLRAFVESEQRLLLQVSGVDDFLRWAASISEIREPIKGNLWDILLLLLVTDFGYYWGHRLNHEVGVLWASHSVHHSPTRLNFLASHRNPIRLLIPAQFIVIGLFLALPRALGFDYRASLAIFLFILTWQAVVHSEWIPRFWRPLEYVLSTPFHHRLHHSLDEAGRRGNYGGLLILFDRLFGTCVERVPAQALSYGLIDHAPTDNPITISFQEWARLGRAAWKEKSFWKFIEIFFVPASVVRFFAKPKSPVESHELLTEP